MMKVSSQVQRLYSEIHPIALELQKHIERHLQDICNTNQWLYLSRIKSLESFAQKLETGRYRTIDRFDDFFACTIVVKNIKEISDAIELIKKKFNIVTSKPTDRKMTKNRPENFSYDSLRLYCKVKQIGPAREFHRLLFEIQIKTFLEHAWAIATHDFTYKTDKVSWGKDRIVSQLKAMLDNVELTINKFDDLSESDYINKSHDDYKLLNDTIDFYIKYWGADRLPKDKRRLAVNTVNLLKKLDISIQELEIMLIKENEEKRGCHTLSLSPYQIIIQTLSTHKTKEIEDLIKNNNNKYYLLLTSNMDIPVTYSKDKVLYIQGNEMSNGLNESKKYE